MQNPLNRRQFIQTSAAGITAGLSVATLPLSYLHASENGHGKKPNLVIFIADDHSKADYGFMGEKNIITPNTDMLAAQSLLIENAYTPTAMCAPSRSTLYTGCYPVRHGCYMNHGDTDKQMQSIAQYLKPLGYDIVLVGKSHVKPRSVYDFQTINFNKQKSLPVKAVAQKLAQEKPICLIYASNQPHAPHKPGRYTQDDVTIPDALYPTRFIKQKRAEYWADCEREDVELGKLLKLVDESDAGPDNTVFFYTSDHGYSTTAKWTCYETGLNMPMLIRWPGRIKSGKTDAMISFTDLLPTLVELAGGEAPKAHEQIDGTSFLPVLMGQKNHHNKYLFGIHTNQGILNGKPFPIRSVRDTRYKYIRNLNHTETPTNVANYNADFTIREDGDLQSLLNALKKHPDKKTQIQPVINRVTSRPAEELYDLQNDPSELQNLMDQPKLATIQRTLSDQLDAWMKQQGDTGLALEMKVKQRLRGAKH